VKWHLEAERITRDVLTACGRPGLMTDPGPINLVADHEFRCLPQQAQCLQCRMSKQLMMNSWRKHGLSATREMVIAVETALVQIHRELENWPDVEQMEQCGQCGAEVLGYHACEGVPGGFGDDY
jgi:hypothetical protein